MIQSFLRRLAILAGLMLCLPAAYGPAWAAPTVFLQPSISALQLGQPFSVSVVAQDLTDLYAFQFDLSYDPDIVALGLVQEGDFLASAGATFFDPGSLDPASGLLTFTLGALLGPGPGASGSGALATLHFDSISSGSTAFSLLNVVLLDSSLGDITAEVLGTSVFIGEPGVLALLAAALAAAGPLRRRVRLAG